MKSILRALPILAIAALLSGCGNDAVRPRANEPAPWSVTAVPLDVGTSWDYGLSLYLTFTDEDGAAVREPLDLTASGTRRITGRETIDGREYVLEEYHADVEGEPVISWRRFRQDADALYMADLSESASPGSADTLTDVAERVRLRYPVTEGDTWFPREGSEAVMLTVEARDTLALASGDTPAWRVRVDIATAGPNDTLYLWYGTQGLLRREMHTEFDAIDTTTGRVVHVVSDDVEVLSAFNAPAR